MARDSTDPAQPRDATPAPGEAGSTNGALQAARPGPAKGSPTSRDGVIGGRPAAAPEPAAASEPEAEAAVEPQAPAAAPEPDGLAGQWSATPIAEIPVPVQAEARAESAATRAYAAQVAQAVAERPAAPVALPMAVPAWSAPPSALPTALPAALTPDVPRPGRPGAPNKPGTAWGLHVGQVVAWQVAIVGVLIAIQQPLAVMIPLLLGAALLLAATVLRSGGRWAYQWLGLWLRFVARRRVRTVDAGAPAAELAGSLLRGLRLETIEIDDVEKVLLTHAGGLTAILQLTPADGGMLVESAVTVPPTSVLLPLGEEAGPPVSAQLVVQTTPAPGAYGAHGPVAQSYHSLAQGQIPARRRSWIALQAMRTAADDTADDSELREALLRAVVRLQRRLQRVGMRGHVLDEAQFSTDLGVLSGTETMWHHGGTPSIRLQEQWVCWQAGWHPQVTYRLLEWPDLSGQLGQDFFDQLVTLPSVATTVGIAARRSANPEHASVDDEVELEAALRVTVPLGQPDLLAAQLGELAERHGVRIQRMNGEHVFGVAASLPLGGFIT